MSGGLMLAFQKQEQPARLTAVTVVPSPSGANFKGTACVDKCACGGSMGRKVSVHLCIEAAALR